MSDQTLTDRIWLRKILRIYGTGLIVLVIAFFVWKVVFQYSPWFDIFENPVLAGGLTVISLVIGPLILGGIFKYGVNPVFGKWNKWSELMSLEDRIIGELAAKQVPEVVVIDWPSTSIQTVGIVTARFPETDTQAEMAAVFHPHGKSGFMRIVKVADLHFTDWTFHEYQVFTMTLGAIHPERLIAD